VRDVDPDVAHCMQMISEPVRGLRGQYPPTTIVLAMLGQAAASLRSLVEHRVVTRTEALRYCQEFGTYVLAREAK
jgi:hypothetical protein